MPIQLTAHSSSDISKQLSPTHLLNRSITSSQIQIATADQAFGLRKNTNARLPKSKTAKSRKSKSKIVPAKTERCIPLFLLHVAVRVSRRDMSRRARPCPIGRDKP